MSEFMVCTPLVLLDGGVGCLSSYQIVMKNQYREGECLKRGAWSVSSFKRVLGKKEGVDTPMHATRMIFLLILQKVEGVL